MKSESRFWNNTLESLNPGWVVSLDPRHPIGDGSLASYDAFVYVVDTSTAWMVAGALPGREMLRAAGDASATPDMAALVLSGVAGMIAELGKGRPEAGSQNAQHAVTAAVLAITQQSLFERVRAACNGQVSGHWFYLVYRLRNGDLLGRAVYLRQEGKGLASQDDCRGVVLQTMQRDRDPASNVGKSIAEGGGLVLAPEFSATPPA